MRWLRLWQREQLASKILEIGKCIARHQPATDKQNIQSGVPNGKGAQDAIKWIQKALALVEKTIDGETPGVCELKARCQKRDRVGKARVDYNVMKQRAILRNLGICLSVACRIY